MNIIDISWPISSAMTEYKNRKTVNITPVPSERDYYMQETLLSLNVHTGTHVDAPAHFVQGGATLDQFALQAMIGDCIVLDLSFVEDCITLKNIQNYPLGEQQIVLLRTKNSLLSPTDLFSSNFVYLAADAARYLVAQKVKAVGIDYLGIERNQADHATHKVLMQAQIPIIEGLRLGHVAAKSYFFCCLPLNLVGTDAAPARAILFDRSEV